MTATAGDDATLSIDGARLDVPVVKIGALIPISREMLHDAGHLRWELPDRNPMPRLVPFPRLARAQRRLAELRQRAHDALEVLRHGLPETDW